MSKQDIEALKVEFSERSRPIVFWTGAGLSAPTLPSWTGLRDQLLSFVKDRAKNLNPTDQARQMAEHSQIKGSTDLWLQFERLENTIGREAYVRRIKEVLAISERAAIPTAQTRLWEMQPAGIVTLNLDLFTQRAAESHPKRSLPIAIIPGKFNEHLNILKERRPFIAYPHGHIDDPQSWTFSKSDLANRLGDSKYVEWLTILFRASTIVFVGISADDVALGSPVDRIVSNSIPLSGHYWITARDDIAADDWAGQHGINVIRYDNKSGKHTELLQLLQELSAPVRAEDPKKEQPIFLRSIGSMPAVFPSPEELAKQSDEEQRQLLNAQAKFILETVAEPERDQAYSNFLEKYGRAVHVSWYASTTKGQNEFLGYTLLEEVDGGAFGTVYKGVDRFGAQIALKLLKSENLRRAGFHKSFRRGANSHRIITDRRIEGVIEFIDAAEIPPTIVMKWSDGRSLNALVESNKVSDWDQRMTVAVQLAKILRTCHALPERVLHRDLRPANVLVEEFYEQVSDWRVVVLDFDLSWHKGAEDHSIMHSPAFGYLAPEQRSRGRFTTRSALVDSYGYGMTLYFLCSGRNPFPDQHLHTTWEKDVYTLFEQRRCSAWISLPRRLARLVINSTQNDQSARLSMNQIEGEVEALKSAMEGSKNVGLVDVIVEEIAARTQHFHGYTWSEQESTAKIFSASGLSYSLQTLPGKRAVELTIQWSNSGAQDWSHIDRMLSQAVPKIEASLKHICESVRSSKERRAFLLTATIDPDAALADPRLFAEHLDKSLAFASAIANF